MTSQTRTWAKWVFIIIDITGTLFLLDFLKNPSEINNQVLFGFSRIRFAVAILFSFLLIINIIIGLMLSFKFGKQWDSLESKVSGWLIDHLLLIFVFFCFIAVTAGIVLLILIPPVIHVFDSFAQIGIQVGGFLFWIFLSSSLLSVLLRISHHEFFRENKTVTLIDRFLLLAGIFLFVFFSYEHILFWTGGANQSRYSYWNLLADEFLHGRLYLQHPPQTHDLTLYNGKWYVPMPPTPAILMTPLAYLIGGANINTSNFSIVFSAINAVLAFLILERVTRYKWIKLSTIGSLLLVVLFAFGTPHLWVGLRGRAWFVSQIVAVTFISLAVFAALKLWSPWLAGICIAIAIGSRPNTIMTWPFVFAIAMQIQKEMVGNVNLRQTLLWFVKSVLPMGMAVTGLLLYNYARFQDFFDFGYKSISGDPVVIANAQTYGLFSLHYIPANLKAMFINVPAIQFGSEWPILPSTVGMSIFLVTPPLLYLFHHYEWRWWIIGAWSSVFLNFLLLITYHNTGAHQFGYRYLLDFIIPLLVLLASALNGKIKWHYVALLLFSVAINIYGTFWFING